MPKKIEYVMEVGETSARWSPTSDQRYYAQLVEDGGRTHPFARVGPYEFGHSEEAAVRKLLAAISNDNKVNAIPQ